MAKYLFLRLGRGGKFAEQCRQDGVMGVHYHMYVDFSGKFKDSMSNFNQEFIPIFMENHPDAKRLAAGSACGTIWTVFNTFNIGDIVLSPAGNGVFFIGKIVGDYFYDPEYVLPHLRKVEWYEKTIKHANMSDELKRSTRTPGTYANISRHGEEIEAWLKGETKTFDGNEAENMSEFVFEKHLEEFLERNWDKTPLGNDYFIYEDEEGGTGRQYVTDVGEIDILAVSKDQKKLLVIELKRGRTSDQVVGQIQRYMGFVKRHLAEPDQEVHGLIIAFDADERLEYALSVTQNIEFYKYHISFSLEKI